MASRVHIAVASSRATLVPPRQASYLQLRQRLFNAVATECRLCGEFIQWKKSPLRSAQLKAGISDFAITPAPSDRLGSPGQPSRWQNRLVGRATRWARREVCLSPTTWRLVLRVSHKEAKQEIATRALFAPPKEREAVLSVYDKGIQSLRNW